MDKGALHNQCARFRPRGDGGVPRLRAEWLLSDDFAALFGPEITAAPITPGAHAPITPTTRPTEIQSDYVIYRVPDDAVRRLVERAPANAALVLEWQKNLAARVPPSRFVEVVDEELTAQVYELATKAFATHKSVFGFVG
jgi:hypothetical protein